eukprot:1012980_1
MNRITRLENDWKLSVTESLAKICVKESSGFRKDILGRITVVLNEFRCLSREEEFDVSTFSDSSVSFPTNSKFVSIAELSSQSSSVRSNVESIWAHETQESIQKRPSIRSVPWMIVGKVRTGGTGNSLSFSDATCSIKCVVINADVRVLYEKLILFPAWSLLVYSKSKNDRVLEIDCSQMAVVWPAHGPEKPIVVYPGKTADDSQINLNRYRPTPLQFLKDVDFSDITLSRVHITGRVTALSPLLQLKSSPNVLKCLFFVELRSKSTPD